MIIFYLSLLDFILILLPFLFISILALGYNYFKKDKRFCIANNFLIAVVATIVLALGIWTLSISYFGGYLLEQIAFYNRAMGSSFFRPSLGCILVLVLALFNYSRKFRASLKFQFLIIVIFSVLLMPIGYSSAVIPGWHTTIHPIQTWTDIFLLFFLGLVLNFLLIKFKILPEFRTGK